MKFLDRLSKAAQPTDLSMTSSWDLRTRSLRENAWTHFDERYGTTICT